jgi:hypothetical protein
LRKKSIPFRQRAELAAGEALGLDIKNAIEARAPVFPRDHGGDFDKLPLVKLPPQRGKQIFRDIGRILCHGDGEAQHQAFPVVEMRARFKVVQVVQLIFGDSGFSAPGRVNVESKWTADQGRRLELRQFFQFLGHGAARGHETIEKA